MPRQNLTRFLTLLAVAFSLNAAHADPQVTKNPYENVDWGAVNHYVANFHAHTVLSDGRAEPDVVIHAYADAGYDILALSDHDNYHVHREGERRIPDSSETTWPWWQWIEEHPDQLWHNHDGTEIAAFYPDLGAEGMFAIRANELTQHPHISSLFNDTGFPRTARTDEDRVGTVATRGGISYLAHPTDYVPGGRWENRLFDADWDKAVDYYARLIRDFDTHLGIEMQLRGRRDRDVELFDRLLAELYPEHDIFVEGSDDNHSGSVGENAPLTIVLAEELTEPAIRDALTQGHNFVASRAESYPHVNAITVDEQSNTIHVDVENHDQIRWIVDGQEYATGETFVYADLSQAIVRFEIDYAEDRTLYAQGFYIE